MKGAKNKHTLGGVKDVISDDVLSISDSENSDDSSDSGSFISDGEANKWNDFECLIFAVDYKQTRLPFQIRGMYKMADDDKEDEIEEKIFSYTATGSAREGYGPCWVNRYGHFVRRIGRKKMYGVYLKDKPDKPVIRVTEDNLKVSYKDSSGKWVDAANNNVVFMFEFFPEAHDEQEEMVLTALANKRDSYHFLSKNALASSAAMQDFDLLNAQFIATYGPTRVSVPTPSPSNVNAKSAVSFADSFQSEQSHLSTPTSNAVTPGLQLPTDFPALHPSFSRERSKKTMLSPLDQRDAPAETPLAERLASLSTEKKVKETSDVKRVRVGKTRFLNQYMMKETLGQGAYGVVKLAVDMETNTKYAVKVIDKSRLSKPMARGRKGRVGGKKGRIGGKKSRQKAPSLLDNVKREIEIMKSLSHMNCVKLIEVIEDEENYYLFLEYIPAGSIDPVMKQAITDVATLRSYMRDILYGLEYLHSMRFFHGDIKPENILLGNDGHLKLSDFGVSQIMSGGESRITALETTPAFQPPEVDTRNYQAWPADIWATGLVFFLMLSGRHPFLGKSIPDTYDNIRNVEPELPDYVDPDARDMCMRMLDKDPETRIGFKGLRQHPFITNHGAEPWINLKDDIMKKIDEAERARQESLALKKFDEIETVKDSATEKLAKDISGDGMAPLEIDDANSSMEESMMSLPMWSAMSSTMQTLHHASVRVVYLDSLPLFFVLAALSHIAIFFFTPTRWLCAGLLFISFLLFLPICSSAKLKCPVLIKIVPIEYAACLIYFDFSIQMITYAFCWTLCVLQNYTTKVIAPQVVTFAMHFWLFVSICVDLMNFYMDDNDPFDGIHMLFPFAFFNVFVLIVEKLWTIYQNEELLTVFE